MADDEVKMVPESDLSALRSGYDKQIETLKTQVAEGAKSGELDARETAVKTREEQNVKDSHAALAAKLVNSHGRFGVTWENLQEVSLDTLERTAEQAELKFYRDGGKVSDENGDGDGEEKDESKSRSTQDTGDGGGSGGSKGLEGLKPAQLLSKGFAQKN